MKMKHNEIVSYVEKIFSALEELVPVYMKIPEDYELAKGVVSVCIIDETGNIYGKIFGTDKLRGRDSFKIAWTKASQVWITGIKTGEYEKLVFSDQIDHHKYGINMPDMIGWIGGQPITLHDGTKLSVGFSGFTGTTDVEIVVKALEKIGEITK
jgi:glc operon protein GlcG